MLLLRTVHGSRLYGLHNENSDYDWYEVHSNEPKLKSTWVQQKIVGQDDTLRIDLSTFMLYADRSAHQTLDAMFSKQCEVNLIEDLCKSYRINTGTFVPLYNRTIRNFWELPKLKHKRHAVRLTLQLQQGLTYGRFDPTMDRVHAEGLLDMQVDELGWWKDNLYQQMEDML